MTMRLTFKYHLNPTKAQRTALQATLDWHGAIPFDSRTLQALCNYADSPMKLTAKVKLLPTPEQYHLLTTTLRTVNQHVMG